LTAFAQRIASRCYLEPWNASETRQYVVNQLTSAGGNAQTTFKGEALDAVFRATDGIPRIVNQLCDHALVLAFAEGRSLLDAADVESAWADLQQLPTPWSDGSHGRETPVDADSNLIEFGGLDDDSEPSDHLDAEEIVDAGQRPTVLLREIEEQLATLGDDFASVPTVGPPNPSARVSHPFHEMFEEEIVLVDRYASFEVGRFVHQRAVHSLEGRLLSALLEPHLRQSMTPQLSLVEAPQTELPEANADGARYAGGRFSAVSIDACCAPAATAVEWTFAGSELPQAPAFNSLSVSITAGNESAAALPAELRGDSPMELDLMIVEEDPHPEPHAVKVRGIPLAKRQEYRQLFSMLRASYP
jgi:hypothetical protein